MSQDNFYGKFTFRSGTIIFGTPRGWNNNYFYGPVDTPDGDEELRRSINEAEEFVFESAFEQESSMELDGIDSE